MHAVAACNGGFSFLGAPSAVVGSSLIVVRDLCIFGQSAYSAAHRGNGTVCRTSVCPAVKRQAERIGRPQNVEIHRLRCRLIVCRLLDRCRQAVISCTLGSLFLICPRGSVIHGHRIVQVIDRLLGLAVAAHLGNACRLRICPVRNVYAQRDVRAGNRECDRFGTVCRIVCRLADLGIDRIISCKRRLSVRRRPASVIGGAAVSVRHASRSRVCRDGRLRALFSVCPALNLDCARKRSSCDLKGLFKVCRLVVLIARELHRDGIASRKRGRRRALCFVPRPVVGRTAVNHGILALRKSLDRDHGNFAIDVVGYPDRHIERVTRGLCDREGDRYALTVCHKPCFVVVLSVARDVCRNIVRARIRRNDIALLHELCIAEILVDDTEHACIPRKACRHTRRRRCLLFAVCPAFVCKRQCSLELRHALCDRPDNLTLARSARFVIPDIVGVDDGQRTRIVPRICRDSVDASAVRTDGKSRDPRDARLVTHHPVPLLKTVVVG